MELEMDGPAISIPRPEESKTNGVTTTIVEDPIPQAQLVSETMAAGTDSGTPQPSAAGDAPVTQVPISPIHEDEPAQNTLNHDQTPATNGVATEESPEEALQPNGDTPHPDVLDTGADAVEASTGRAMSDIQEEEEDREKTPVPESRKRKTPEPTQPEIVHDVLPALNGTAAESHRLILEPRPPSMLTSPLTHPNGTSMFPELSTIQQEDIAWEALNQAEGSIVADSDETSTIHGDDETERSDAGYESDSLTTASTSIEASVRDYMYENGRRYHRFREGRYNFPNDDIEQEREDMKHAMVKLLCSQKLHFAPIGDNPQQVLDIGTGTGIWAIEMGDQYPSATVLGVDLSPIQPDWVPPNVKFMVDDIESAWLHPRNHFDYIHSRHTVMAIKDWMRLFRRSLEHLKPGGWIELQEIHHYPTSADGTMAPTHPVAQYWGLVNQGLTALGVDFHAAAGGQLANRMREAGFVNVTERVFHVPIGTWPRNKVLKTVGLYWRTILMDGIQAIALGPFSRGLRWTTQQIEVFLVGVRAAYHDNTALMYMPMHIVYAQKPLSGY